MAFHIMSLVNPIFVGCGEGGHGFIEFLGRGWGVVKRESADGRSLKIGISAISRTLGC